MAYNLNPEQQKAADSVNGPFICIAGPGAGKTRTLVIRVANMVRKGVEPNSILVLTFTNAAAKEMRARYEAMEGTVPGPQFSTIHSFALFMVKNELKDRNYEVFAGAEQIKYIKNLIKDSGIKRTVNDIKRIARNLVSDISAYKGSGESDSFKPKSFKRLSEFKPYYKEYVEYKKMNNLIDFDDMLFICADLLKDPAIQKKWSDHFRYIICDEWQDTSLIQCEIIYTLARPRNNICVFGDEDQSIYEFRQARPDVLLNFPKQFPGCGIAKLTVNYRSDEAIIDASKNLISNNKQRFNKEITGNSKNKGIVHACRVESRTDQLDSIIKDIRELSQSIPYKEMAVLCRTNKEVNGFVRKFSDNDIPFYSPEVLENFHETWIFETCLTYLKIATGKHNLKDIQYIMSRPARYLKSDLIKQSGGNISVLESLYQGNTKAMKSIKWLKQDIRDIQAHAIHTKNLESLLKYIDAVINIKKYITDYCTYHVLDPEYYLDIYADILKEVSGYTNIDDYIEYIQQSDEKIKSKKNGTYDGVVISTIHKAKGLEWDVVFIPSCGHGNLPYVPKDEDEKNKQVGEEERRLFYVAMTRARKKCIMYTFDDEEKQSEYLCESKIKIYKKAGG